MGKIQQADRPRQLILSGCDLKRDCGLKYWVRIPVGSFSSLNVYLASSLRTHACLSSRLCIYSHPNRPKAWMDCALLSAVLHILKNPRRHSIRDAPSDIWGGGGLEFLLLANLFFTPERKQSFFFGNHCRQFFCMFRRRNFLSYAFPIM